MISSSASREGRTTSCGIRASDCVGQIELFDKAGRSGVHVKDAGQHLAFFVRLSQQRERADLAGGVVFAVELAQAQL